jgi:anti-sigma B factor antagonist
MQELNIFQSSKLDNKSNTILITLGKQILGGSEALEFSNYIANTANEGISHIIIDMANIEVINSSGMGMLVSGLSQTKKLNMSLILVSMPEKVKNLFKMTHLDEVFKIAESVEKAVSEINI